LGYKGWLADRGSRRRCRRCQQELSSVGLTDWQRRRPSDRPSFWGI